MQSASSNFTAEISGGQVTWAKPRVFADWAGDGYGATGSIDDLSEQVGESFTIVHTLDDGLPDDVSLATTQDAVTLDLPLAYGRTPGAGVAEGNRRASQYFSPYNGSSPVSGFQRDVAPVKLDWGLVHAGGQEHVRLFTGQMTNLRTRGQGAEMVAQSATRLKLMKLIQPPAVDAEGTSTGSRLALNTPNGGPGMNATWPVSYALAKCGVYVSPPPRTGCRLWMPMHGSLAPFIPDANDPTVNATAPGSTDLTAAGVTTYGTPNWQAGPFLLGTADFVTATESKRTLIYRVGFGPGADLLSQVNNTGRVEFWIKGDAAEVVSPPGGAGNVPWLAGFDFKTPTAVRVKAGVGTDRKVYLTIDDGTGPVTVQSSDTLPTDGAWHFVGAAWDFANNLMWVTNFAGGYSGFNGIPALLTTNLPAVDTWDYANLQPSWSAHLPVAEVQVTSGAQANPDNFPWINDPAYWSIAQAGAIMRPSFLELRALAEPVPREAWELIGSYAQAELAQTRTDELDKFNYLPMSYWAETAQQTVVDTVSTSLNASDIDVDLDPSKIRNSVRVTYTGVNMETLGTPLFTAFGGPAIPPGESFYTIAFDTPATDIWPFGFQYLNDTSFTAPWIVNYVTLSTDPQGGAPYATSADVDVSIDSWHAGGCVIRYYNKTPQTFYPVNTSNQPSIQVAGTKVNQPEAAVVGQDTYSISLRGERALAVSLPAITNAADAQAIADELATRLAKPTPTVSGINLFADPRRQPGDLVTLTDAVNTGASGLWRVQSITHTRQGAEYTQQCTLVKASQVMTWDVNNWDETIWGA